MDFISASYASGSVTGGAGVQHIGGFAGLNLNTGQIIANYTTSNVNGGADAGSNRGKLVGLQGSTDGVTIPTLMHSYGFGTTTTIGNGTDANPTGLLANNASQLSDNAANTNFYVGNSWDSDANKTLDAWRFEDSSSPRLQYNDYDGAGNEFHCENNEAEAHADAILIPYCGQLLFGPNRQR